MYIPRFLVTILPAPQGGWKWFRRRCTIAIIDTSKLDKDTVLDLESPYLFVPSTPKSPKHGYIAKQGPGYPVIKEYMHLDSKRRGPRSRFGKTLKMAQELATKLNNSEKVLMDHFILSDKYENI